ncbi:hypothetical protein F4813DRAFT_71400 [Daldinia decipiens]|uniref:uncharacterized protein n=1 Tax=Daldinia decipiens TaxID=326647 RepID=UPI0020C30031|nr:uncharacterized protein F4813DRAFT_71400 [Daldinia decipiens]KAI1657657.1 hypothetical protein F4813DRAFT_71400 [Daldinia decipiens]
MLFKYIISAATLSAFYEVANASRCRPRTSSSEPIPTTSSYSLVPSSTYAVSITTLSSFASATSSVAISSTISDSSIASSTESSSIIPLTSSSLSSSVISSTESIIATETASSTNSSEISSSESVSATETISSTISSTTSSISSVETSSTITSSSITPSSTSSLEIPSTTSSTTSAEPTPTNIQAVINSGFEIADPIIWTFPGYRLDMAASGSLDTDPFSGSRSFIAQGLPGLWQIRLQQTVSVVTGQAYSFQYTLKMDPPAGCVMDVLINNVRTRRPNLTQNRGLYTTYTDPWTATSDTATILFSSQCSAGGPANKLYYDDITLTTVDAPEVTIP